MCTVKCESDAVDSVTRGSGQSDRTTSAGHGSAHCEQDAKWLGVKRRLFSVLDLLRLGHRVDVPRTVDVVTRGISEGDFARCPLGTMVIRLFLQLLLAVGEPAAVLAEVAAARTVEQISAPTWQGIPAESWHEFTITPWQEMLHSRWPVFEVLTATRDLLLRAREPQEDECIQLWHKQSSEHQAALSAANNAGHVAGIGLRLPPSACPTARATVTLALLHAVTKDVISAPWQQLLQQAQEEASARWTAEFIHTPWPAFPLLLALERQTSTDLARRDLADEGLRGAIVYVHFFPDNPENLRFDDLERSLSSLQTYWFASVKVRWPVIIFADPTSATLQRTRLGLRFPDLDLRVAVIEEGDISWPIVAEHPRCSPGYRRAARFTAGPLYRHAALSGMTHVIVVDTEFELTHQVPWDPFQHIQLQHQELAYWQVHYEATWNRTVLLTEISRQFMVQNGLKPQIVELVKYWWDYEEDQQGSLPVNIYGCLFAGSLRFFRSEPFQAYFESLDAWNGWDKHCWSPQSVLAIAAAFFLGDGDLGELWVFGRHQKSAKTPREGWNDSMLGILSRA